MSRGWPTEAVINRRQRVVELTAQGKSGAEIAAILGITRRTVTRIRRDFGIAQAPAIPLTEGERSTAQALLDDGCCYAEVARTLGRSRHAIERNFPGRAWPPGEGARLALMIRWANHRIAKVAA